MTSAQFVPLVNQSAFFEFRQPERHCLTAFSRHHWAMMSFAQSETLRFHSAIVLDFYSLRPLGRAPRAAGISIGKRIMRVIEFLQIKIGNARSVNCVTPTQIIVVADNRERHT